MVAILTAVLMTAAEISNLFSVIGVLICLICMIVFIMSDRVPGNVFGTSVVRVSQPPIAQVRYQKVAVPFSLQLHQPHTASFADVQLKIRSEVDYALHTFWGVPSQHLHLLLAAPWNKFFTNLMEEASMGAEVVGETVRTSVEECAECVRRVSLSTSEGGSRLLLGPSPRRKYPLVVCLTRCHDASQHSLDTTVGALITIIHIRDEECRVPSCVLHQYLKQYSGQLTKLEALYTQGNSCTTGESPRQEENVEEDEEDFSVEEACIVCQSKRTTRALLPCRHVCVCDSCCSRLDNCPMCRTRILAYFLVAPEDHHHHPAAASEEGEEQRIDPPSPWNHLTAAVNRMMGLHHNE